MKRIYIAGPCTGYPDLNFPAFHAAAARLRAAGHHVENPAEINADPSAEWLDCMRADIARELGASSQQDERLPVAVNADSLATWVLPALQPVVMAGLVEGFGLELIVDDQDFTHESLREGTVLGCVSTVAEALRGCSATPLGCMRYVAVASPGFISQALPQGLDRGNFARLPWLVFNRKDDNHAVWVGQAFGVQAPRLLERHVPSTEAQTRAAVMGWGLAVVPEPMAAPGLASGALQALHPQVHVDVRLHWHQWKLRSSLGNSSSGEIEGATPTAVDRPLRAGVLDRIGRALAEGARAALRPPG